jgi:ligand-binding sensor protein
MHVQIPLMAIRMELLEPLIFNQIQTNLTQSITLQKHALNVKGKNISGFRNSTRFLTFYA